MKVWVLQCTSSFLGDLNDRELTEEILASPTVHSTRLGAEVWVQECVAEEVKAFNDDREEGEPQLEVPTVIFNEHGWYEFEDIDMQFQIHELEVQGS